jgi:hypothetical protein
VLWA